MSRFDKLLLKLLHHIYRLEGLDERVTLQPAGKDAKPYQVKQVRDLVVKYGPGGDE